MVEPGVSEAGDRICAGVGIFEPKSDSAAGRPPVMRQLSDWQPPAAVVYHVRKYTRLHESILGKYSHHGLPPKPNTKQLEMLNLTFVELLTKHNLPTILDICSVYGFGSYAFQFDVPALYGLWCVTRESLLYILRLLYLLYL